MSSESSDEDEDPLVSTPLAARVEARARAEALSRDRPEALSRDRPGRAKKEVNYFAELDDDDEDDGMFD